MVSRVLVVLPTLGDRIDTLKEAIASVEMQQRECSIRLVVVAPDRAVEARAIALAAGATVVDDPREGLAGAMNAGIAAASGEEFYVGLGDDDLLRPNGVRTLLALADAQPRAVVYFGACDYIDSEGRIIGTNRAGRAASMILSWGPNLIPHPGSLIRLVSLQAVGGFALKRPYTMDLDAFLKLKGLGRFVSTRTSVSAFRWHRDSLTVAGRGESAREALAVKRAHLPAWARPLSFLWLRPVAWATENAGRLVNRRAAKISRDDLVSHGMSDG